MKVTFDKPKPDDLKVLAVCIREFWDRLAEVFGPGTVHIKDVDEEEDGDEGENV